MNVEKEYDLWVRSIDEPEKQELNTLEAKEKEDRFYRELEFGTAGMRGIIAMGTNRMNKYTVMRATAGLAELIREAGAEACAQGVMISYDSRKYSRLFAECAAEVLAQAGIRAYLYDELRPVPMLSFAIRKLGTFAGIMITASHNPPEYNGYKVYGADGAQMSPENAAKVVRAMDKYSYFGIPAMQLNMGIRSGLITMVGREMDEAYYQEILKLRLCPEVMAQVPEFCMVYTPLHGSGCTPVCTVLERMGLKNLLLVREQAEPDENFSTVSSPNPENSEAFDLGLELAKKHNADAIIATDPDADRMGLALRDKDGQFRILTGNQIGCLLAYHIFTQRAAHQTLPGNAVLVKTIVSTELASVIAQSYGARVVNVLTGFKFIGEQIKEYEETGSGSFVFGFEESYGYLAGTYCRDKDAVAASMLITEMAAVYALQGKTLLDALNEIYERYGFYKEETISVMFEGKEGMSKMTSIMEDIREHPPTEIGGMDVEVRRDYLKLQMTRNDGSTEDIVGFPESDCLHYTLSGGCWACIRPSGTEPKIKVYTAVRAQTEQEAERMIEKLKSDMTSLLN